MNRNIEAYGSAYLAEYGFEKKMVEYRRKMLLERLADQKPKVVLEIGCGAELLYEYYRSQGADIERWIIVEPNLSFVNAVRGRDLPNLEIVHGFFEDVSDSEVNIPNGPDFIICSSVLHEVPDSNHFLSAIVKSMGKNTLLHVNVPNARSFHRRLAKSMNLINNYKELSERNQRLQQNRVYEAITLEADLRHSGLVVVNSGGYLIKPFTHSQMASMSSLIDQQLLDGLYSLGKENPEWASEIFVEARRPVNA